MKKMDAVVLVTAGTGFAKDFVNIKRIAANSNSIRLLDKTEGIE